MKRHEVDYHYCPDCGFRMVDVVYMSLIAAVPCPGRGGVRCGKSINRFHTVYKKKARVKCG